jgi:hypothetical protein
VRGKKKGTDRTIWACGVTNNTSLYSPFALPRGHEYEKRFLTGLSFNPASVEAINTQASPTSAAIQTFEIAAG